MNPNNPSPSQFELPAPEVGNNKPSQETAARPETAPLPSQAMPIPQQPVTLGQAPAAMPSPQAQTPSPQPATAAPDIADDADLIEKEWVEKAKAIVAATHSDPRAQSRELNKFKADYLKKRYNKVIKVDES